MCSLRLNFHLKKWQEPGFDSDVLIVVLDNCVGQNKSQNVLKFFAMLSVLKYKKVVLFYLIPGHSHMIADRVVAWLKNKIKTTNIYHPHGVVEKANSINTVEAKFFSVGGGDTPFCSGWRTFLPKHFPGQMPGGYTGNYMFEFDAGVCTYRQLATTPDAEAQQVSLLPADWSAERVRDLISRELFGSTDPKEWTMQNVTLPNAAPKEMTAKKLKSLAKKYCTIPVEYRSYYPDVTDVDVGTSDEEEGAAAVPVIKKRPKRKAMAQGAAKPKRSKKYALAKGTRSIMSFFSPLQ